MSFDASIDPTAGESAGSDATTDTQAAADTTTAVANPAPTRTYTDADLAGLRRSERARYQSELQRETQRQLAEARAQWEQENRSRQDEPTLDPQAEALLQRYIGQATTPLVQQFQDMSLDRAVERMKAQHPDFDEASVIQTAAQYGLGKNDDMTYDQILDLAYRYQTAEKYRNPTADTIPAAIRGEIEKAAVAKYLADKSKQATTTARPEGRGGSGPVGAPKGKTTFKDAEAAMREAIKRSREHAG